MKSKAKREFRLNFNGHIGSQFEKIRIKDAVNSEGYKADDDQILPTNRRWIQLLDGADIITQGYKEQNGRVKISDLATRKYKYKIISCDNLSKVMDELSRKSKYQALLADPQKKENIDGFSIPGKKKIYHKTNLTEEQKNFVIAHELSHFLLGHEGRIFFKCSSKSGENKELLEKPVYNEEADKLAAFLLMPYIHMQELVKESNDDIAKQFKVPVRAVEKRKKELETEMNIFCYIPPSIRK